MAEGMGIKGVGVVNERHPKADFARFQGIKGGARFRLLLAASIIKEQGVLSVDFSQVYYSREIISFQV